MQKIQKHVAAVGIFVLRLAGAVLKKDVAIHAQFCGSGRSLARVVGLRGPLRQHNICPLLARFSHQEFEFAGLVATAGQPGAVVTLDPNLGAIQLTRQIVEPFQRCWQMGKANTGKPGEIHSGILNFMQ